MPRLEAPLALLVVTATLMAGCTADTAPPCTPSQSPPGAEGVCFITADGWVIQGVHHEANATDAPTALLLHGFREQHAQYDNLAQRLATTGLDVLAIDLRGHGESTRNTQGPDRSIDRFTQADVAAMWHDVNASQAYLDQTPDAIVGASIGANLALAHAAEHPATDALVLLSPIPGQGPLDPVPANERYEGAVYYVAAEGDRRAAPVASGLHEDHTGGPASLDIYNGTAHGTQHLDNATRLDRVADWVTTHTTPDGPDADTSTTTAGRR